MLFALNNFTVYSFDKTWPVLMIVFGLLSLLQAELEPAPPPPPPPPLSAAAVYFPPPPSSYAQSTYAQPVPAKGGFGGSAPRPADAPGQNPPAVPGDSV